MLRSRLQCRSVLLVAQARHLSSRARAVLSAIDLPVNPESDVIPGVFDGQWGGTGEELVSRCPATGEVIGRIRGVGRECIPCTDYRPRQRRLVRL
jgi:hypothetical protein